MSHYPRPSRYEREPAAVHYGGNYNRRSSQYDTYEDTYGSQSSPYYVESARTYRSRPSRYERYPRDEERRSSYHPSLSRSSSTLSRTSTGQYPDYDDSYGQAHRAPSRSSSWGSDTSSSSAPPSPTLSSTFAAYPPHHLRRSSSSSSSSLSRRSSYGAYVTYGDMAPCYSCSRTADTETYIPGHSTKKSVCNSCFVNKYGGRTEPSIYRSSR